jgi:hypothetical protein
VPLLKADAVQLAANEFLPVEAFAIPVANRVTVPRIIAGPRTSSVALGVVVLMPILAVGEAPIETAELPIVDAPVNRGTKFVVPVPVIVAAEERQEV